MAGYFAPKRSLYGPWSGQLLELASRYGPAGLLGMGVVGAGGLLYANRGALGFNTQTSTELPEEITNTGMLDLLRKRRYHAALEDAPEEAGSAAHAIPSMVNTVNRTRNPRANTSWARTPNPDAWSQDWSPPTPPPKAEESSWNIFTSWPWR